MEYGGTEINNSSQPGITGSWRISKYLTILGLLTFLFLNINGIITNGHINTDDHNVYTKLRKLDKRALQDFNPKISIPEIPSSSNTINTEKVRAFFEKLTNQSFQGRWHSSEPMFHESGGKEGNMTMESGRDFQEPYLGRSIIVLRILDGQFVTRWFYARAEANNYDNSTITENSAVFYFHTKSLFRGEDFEIINVVKGDKSFLLYRLRFQIYF